MNQIPKETLRRAVLTALVKRAPKSPGRTALMKFAYLLQAVRNVPLGYRFRLYNYGPYLCKGPCPGLVNSLLYYN